ncbi:uncharacterized protein LOC122627529 isoform X1 [Vespula pensylvanica]|uniref:uncharacterized protein LOC122627529 isoform X1 n=1 Tax=Vespula pensylvanica TaxID=30213 RepID=UPI001CB9E972|nr:uncharacterized protein LOC122627529 isoform X1 [Vespula pensylvanica]XP_043664631.1 uncharacterized protein LOC122627529 isoform X1 [Vespula pensylvanica]
MMMTENKAIGGYQGTINFNEQRLFKLQCFIKASDIQHSAQCEYEKRLFLALSTGNADIILYYKKDISSTPIIKRIPWFKGTNKQITAFCFDPYGSWLLATTTDSCLYIIPVLKLVDEKCTLSEQWRTDDITTVTYVGSQSSHSKPTALIWWQDTKTSTNMGIVGTEYGEVILINLENGQQVGTAHVNGHIISLHICKEKSNDSISLLITSKAKQQWRLLLEHRAYSYTRQFENGEVFTQSPTNEMIYENTKSFASTRSRLQGLKQLSVEKLAILRQKLVETKNQNLGENTRYHDTGTNKTSNLAILNIDSSSEDYIGTVNPEPMSKDTFLTPQYDKKGQQIYTCYHLESSHVTVHGSDFDADPLSIHKVPESSENILLTHRLFFVTDATQYTLYVISDQMSEVNPNRDYKFNPGCIIDQFSFENSKEIIHAVYRFIDFANTTSEKLSHDLESSYTLSSKMKDIKIETPYIETCIIVTNYAVYGVVLRKPLLSVFMELVLRRNELDKAGKLALIFGMNSQQLFEYVGDILLTNKEFPRAVASYKLSKCGLLKSILKFASAGHTSELLNSLTHCLISPAISELSAATRIHLSNLCILAFIEMTLRAAPHQSKAIYKDFLYFLSTNSFYDELLAVNIAGQTCLWEVLHHLATQRCLYGQMLDVLMKTVHLFDASKSIPYGLLICLSEPNLMQAMLINPNLARKHISFIGSSISELQIFVLQRLITLYDPTNPIIRPRLVKCKARHRTTSYSSQSSQCDSIDLAENNTEADTLVEEIVETFLLILLTLIHKKVLLNQTCTLGYNIQLMGTRKQEHINRVSSVDFKRRSLSAGFSHVALIRNGDVYTWGSSIQGCLGTGSSVLRYGLPNKINFFRNMEMEVFSVSCGHCHTLAVTNNGIYVWGSSKFGQLGLGKVLQCSSPELITSLAQEMIIDAVAGQYHSMALTADGRVFTWGWGVHGQLGHGNTDKRNTPTLVTSLLGIFIKHISAGHAHSLALSDEGIVYAFGCNVFGQLGINNNIKSSIPTKVLLTEKISLITTGYFHNLALSTTNKLYIWGASPKVLKLQAQALKKTRILEQQEANEKQANNLEKNIEKEGNDTAINKNIQETAKESNKQILSTKIITSSLQLRKKQFEGTSTRNINVGLLEESQAHLKPSLVDTTSVKGRIIQITTGCHHNALLTKDGSLYTWGCNIDGQIGNGTKYEVSIPTPLSYNPASIFAQVDSVADDKNGNVTNQKEENGKPYMENSDNKEKVNTTIKSVGIYCGYDYTVAMQPGGTILAWGNNNRAQLGRISVKDTRDTDEKIVLLKSSNIILDVPNIPAPIISYQSYDIPSLAGFISPLSVIEKSPAELTLHYVLEHFNGLYDSTKIMEKCIELENYQACSNVAALQHNFSDAFSYQLKALSAINFQLSMKPITLGSSNEATTFDKENGSDISSLTEKLQSVNCNLKRNTELFNKQVEKNLIESVEDYAAKNKMKIPSSKSLNSLQTLEDGLYAFDCQGGSEELCKEPKCEDIPLDITENVLDSDVITPDPEQWIEHAIFENNLSVEYGKDDVQDVSSKSLGVTTNNDNKVTTNEERIEINHKKSKSAKEMRHYHKNNLVNEAIKVLKFYLHEIENEADVVKCNILQNALEFWIQHDLSIQSLENIFFEHIHTIFYPLGLLLFCQETIEMYSDENKNDERSKSMNVTDLFSSKFCLQVCSMLLQHINEGQPTPEYIKLLSSLMADHYGIPLTGYPGSSRNNTSADMIEGIISTVSTENDTPRSFVHIKDSDAVCSFLAMEEDSMVFTCGHHYPLSLYQTNIIPAMETELLTSESLLLPCTAQFLGKTLSQTLNPDILCPLCIPKALRALVKKDNK